MSRPRVLPAATAFLVVAVGMVACSRSSLPPAGRMTVDGQVEVTRPGERRQEVTGSRNLKVGDRVRVRQGSAVIRLPDDRRLELRAGSDIEMQAGERNSRVRASLMAGDVLVVSDREPLDIGSSGAEMAVEGDARISRGVSLLVATYEGTARLSSAGSTLTVPALRQATLRAAGQFPTTVAPLEYSAADGWDQRYLSDVIKLSSELDGRSQGFTAQLGPNEGRSYNYFRDLFPRLAAEPAFTASLLDPGRPPGETLVGAAITLEGRRGTFAERWAAVFGFRDEGAPWGLVARDQGVSHTPLVGAVETAISRGPTLFAEGPLTGTPSSLAPPSRGGSPATSGPRSTSTTAPSRGGRGSPVPTTTPPRAPRPPGPTPSPTTSIPTGPLNTGSPVVDDTVNSLVDTLTGLLRTLGGPQ